MASSKKTPYICHVFVCTNDRQGVRKSCADGENANLRAYLKEEINRRGLKGRVRVSSAGCLGLCESGPNVMLYPQGVWYSGVTLADAEEILTRIATEVS